MIHLNAMAVLSVSVLSYCHERGFVGVESFYIECVEPITTNLGPVADVMALTSNTFYMTSTLRRQECYVLKTNLELLFPWSAGPEVGI